jgi:pimeloyl-ACP methyl ester carboxylesterase
VLEAEDYLRLTVNLYDRDPDNAVVLFLNYTSPGALGVLADARALDGAARLGEMLDGYHATREQGEVPARLNVIGHSYGTAIVALALNASDRHVNSVSLVASAGIPDGIDARGLHVDPSHVYATLAPSDGIARLGQSGSGRQDPTAQSWGAVVFGSDGEVLPDGTRLDPVQGHNAIGGNEIDDRYRYFGPNTESLVNIIAISKGEHTLVTR